MSPVVFVCPLCRGPLRFEHEAYNCPACRRVYPVVCGIPDFRLEPDPYISIEDDRRKGARLHERSHELTFEQLVRHYYATTPDDPPDLAARWTARALQEVEIARMLMDDPATAAEHPRTGAALLDIGCSTGARLIAFRDRYETLAGVDVAFRWLILGARRLREAKTSATLVCANAERLPFASGSFDAVTAFDVLEHVRDASATAREACRVSAGRARFTCSVNNRYAPLPEPNIRVWGVGYLPRRWQRRYVAWRRSDLHPYRIALPSAGELRKWILDAGFADVRVEPARIEAPHVHRPAVQRLLSVYNAVRRAPIIRTLLLMLGPKLAATAVRPSPAAQGGATASLGPPLSTTARADR